MKSDFYFQHPIMAGYDPRLQKLIHDEGGRGYGCYWMVREIISVSPHETIELSLISPFCKKYHTTFRYAKKIIFEYDLFNVVDGKFVSAKPLNTVAPSDQEGAVVTSEMPADPSGVSIEMPATPSGVSSELPADPSGVTSELLGKKVNSLKNKQKAGKIIDSNNNINKTTTTTTKEKEKPSSSSDIYALTPVRRCTPLQQQLEELKQPGEWRNLACMQSGYGELLNRYFDAALEEFRQHVVLYDRQTEVEVQCDARRYFLNFVRQGTITSARLHEALKKLDEQEAAAKPDPFRFEQVLDHRRTYQGCPIPDDAPPRPNARAIWVDAQHRWIDSQKWEDDDV